MLLFFDIANEPISLTPDLPMSGLGKFFPIGYLATTLIETPIVTAGLPRAFSLKQRIFSGIWLTACTYPIVVLFLPALMQGMGRSVYLFVAEIFAPAAECILFWLAFRGKPLSSARWMWSFAVIAAANVASFAIGELLSVVGWFGLF